MNEHPHEHSSTGSEHHSQPHHASSEGLPPVPKLDFKGVNMKSLQHGLADILAILKLDKTKIKEVAGRDHEGIGLAFVYIVLAGIAAPLGGMIFGYTLPVLGTVRLSPVNALIGAAVGIAVSLVGFYLANFIAVRFFHGKGHFAGLFRVMGYASFLSVVGFLTFVPIVVMIASIWLLVVYFVVLREVYQLTPLNVVLVIILTGVVVAILFSVLRSFGLTPLSGGFGGGSFSLNY